MGRRRIEEAIKERWELRNGLRLNSKTEDSRKRRKEARELMRRRVTKGKQRGTKNGGRSNKAEYVSHHA